MPIGRSKVARILGALLLTSVVSCAASTAAETQIAGSLRGVPGSPREDRTLDRHGRAIDADRTTDEVVPITFFSTDRWIFRVSRLLDLAAVADALPAGQRSHLRIVALTVDPARDTPDALESFAADLKLDREAATLAFTGRHPADGGADRAPPTVFDRRGAFAMRCGGTPLDRRRLGQDLATLADLDGGAGQGVARASTLG